MTPEAYLAIERAAEYKSEFVRGAMLAMAGATMKHTAIVNNVSGELYGLLKGRRCRILTQDMRGKAPSMTSYFYPDVLGLCGPAQLEDAKEDTLLNPSLVIEVLSPSTEAYDRGEKFFHYQTIATLQEYVLLSQFHPRAEVFTRSGDAWNYRVIEGLDARLTLASIECAVSLADIYRDVDLAAPVPDSMR